jgi:succinate dehydrogenase / fumarate reductase membrane anchor subunit
MHAWTWLFQRISAFLILIVLGFHIGLLHFSNAGEPLKYSDILVRMKTPVFLAMDLLLLICGLYHALYGMYAIFLDFNSGKKERVMVFSLFVAAGLGFFGFGLFGLLYIFNVS